ncbi:MAG: hypothetical protein IFK94_04915 [Acidobacteria bacterium]|uniref:DAGKc domain-containing protein n=1 Tax=Candidatus Polarisedimenticola svalbardensis TaxID=2886004 RepID=A0A8J6Y7K2_9BACT|nr:hypothetical protein [Candidatus Polarisedimenticola svalbardensis]
MAREKDAELVLTRDQADLARQVSRAVDEGVTRLVVGGDDGTLQVAGRGVAGSACSLGIVPLGRGNDFAGALGINPHPAEALAAALEPAVRKIDLGTVNGIPFNCVAGVGFDGDVSAWPGTRSGW